MRIVRAMLAGERDPHALAALSHPGIRASRDTIAKSLEGTWRVDLSSIRQEQQDRAAEPHIFVSVVVPPISNVES